MFWGCFSYDKKGPCHCWGPETAKQKKLAKEEIEKMNEELEPILQREWELSTSMRRLNLRQQTAGPKPAWKWDSKTGRVSRGSGKGIDWYRY